MGEELVFNYRKLKTGPNGEFDAAKLEYYMNVAYYPKIISNYFLDPLQEKLKKSLERSGEKELKTKDESVIITRSDISKTTTLSETVYEKFKTFLKIRADDSRAKQMKGLQKFEGIGYCIAVSDVISAINTCIENATSYPEYLQLNWPRMKKFEAYPHEIIIPDRISIENLDILKPALLARKFCTGIVNEVLEPYEEANKLWFTNKTTYSAKKPPKEEDSPYNAPRKLKNGSYIEIGIERVQSSDYKSIIDTLIQDLNAIEAGSEDSTFWHDYRHTDAKGVQYVNIKRLSDKLEALYKEDLKKHTPYGRFTIVPKVSAD